MHKWLSNRFMGKNMIKESLIGEYSLDDNDDLFIPRPCLLNSNGACESFDMVVRKANNDLIESIEDSYGDIMRAISIRDMQFEMFKKVYGFV